MESGRLDGVRMLVVDDDPDVLEAIGTALRAEGADTQLVRDGNAAVAACQDDPPDIVVLDMMLPKRSGFLVLEKIKGREDSPLVIMVTANEGRRHQAYAESLGVDKYMLKPVPLERLIDVAVELLDREEAEEEEEEEEEGTAPGGRGGGGGGGAAACPVGLDAAAGSGSESEVHQSSGTAPVGTAEVVGPLWAGEVGAARVSSPGTSTSWVGSLSASISAPRSMLPEGVGSPKKSSKASRPRPSLGPLMMIS